MEIEAKEIEQAKKNMREMVQRKNTDNICMLYKDKFNLDNKRVCASFSRAPLWTLIPLYDRVLVPIPPYSSSEKFAKDLGFSVDQLLEFRKRGWVDTLLNDFPSVYSGLSHLDELIRVSPVRSIRNRVFATFLAGGADRLESTLHEGEILFGGRGAPPEYFEHFGERKAKHYPGELATHYALLSVFGFTQSVEQIKELAKSEMEKAEYGCLSSSMLLVSPFLDAMKKTTAYDSEIKDRVSRFYGTAEGRTEPFFVPCWLADLYTNLGFTVPTGMDTDEINAVRKNSEKLIDAVKSLDEEINKTVREKFEGQELEKGEKETITAKKEEFRKRWFEDVVPAFKEIRQTEQVWSIAFTTSIVASALTLSAFAGVLNIPSALAMLLASEKIKKTTDPAAEYFVRFWERNPIHVGFYKVQKEVRKLKHKHR